jgi:hypothetical protein
MRKGIDSTYFYVLALTIIAWLLAANPGVAQTPYYAGKTVTIVRGGGAGGSGEFQSRALIPYLKKYIPGSPNIVMEFMDGASGRKAANYFSTAKPDGLKIASAGNMIPGPILGLSGSSYGARGVRVGAHSVGHSVYITGRMFAHLLDLKEPRFVVGFNDPEMDIALANGELDVRTSGNIDSVLKDQRDQVYFHATISNPRGRFDSRLPGLPDLDSFAKNDRERRVIDLFRAFQVPRWPHHVAPGTPPELVKILREAMARTFKDPEFQQEFKKLMGRDPSPLTGEEVQKVVRELPRDPETVALYKLYAEGGTLPQR